MYAIFKASLESSQLLDFQKNYAYEGCCICSYSNFKVVLKNWIPGCGWSHSVCRQINMKCSWSCNDHTGAMPFLTYVYAPAGEMCRPSLYWPPRRLLSVEWISKLDTQNFQARLFLHFVVLMHVTSNQAPKCEFYSFREIYQHNFITTTCIIMA